MAIALGDIIITSTKCSMQLMLRSFYQDYSSKPLVSLGVN